MVDLDLDYFKNRLFEEKNKILKRLQSYQQLDGEVSRGDAVDSASSIESSHLRNSLIARDNNLMVEIDDALKRIESEDYGFCEAIGEQIEYKRLDLYPWCRYTIEHQEKMERRAKSQNIRGVSFYE